MVLETVQILIALARTSSDCCTDLMKVFVEWAKVNSERG
jgi:hypothetical protein